MDLKTVLRSASKAYFHLEPFSVLLPTSTLPVYGYVSGGWAHEEDTELRLILDIAPDPLLHPRTTLMKALGQACPKWAAGRCHVVTWKREPEFPDKKNVMASLSIKSMIDVMTPEKLLDTRQAVFPARIFGHTVSCSVDYWPEENDGDNLCTWSIEVPCAMLENQEVLVAMQKEVEAVHGVTTQDGGLMHTFTMVVNHYCSSNRELELVKTTMKELGFEASEWDTPCGMWRTYHTVFEWSPKEV